MNPVPVRQRVRVFLREAWPELVTAQMVAAAGITSERAARRALNQLTERGDAMKAPGTHGVYREPATYLAVLPVPEEVKNYA